MSYSNKKKGLQFFTVALIFSTPICLSSASLALASDYPNQRTSLDPNQSLLTSQSSFSAPSVVSTSSLNLKSLQQWQLARTGQLSLVQRQSTGLLNQGGVSSPSSLQSEIDTVRSSLSNYKTHLTQLQAETLKDPSLQSQLDQAISDTKAQITKLQNQLSQAQQDLLSYTQAQQTLQQALDKYSQAQQNTLSVQATLTSSQSSAQDKADTLVQVQRAQSQAQSDFDRAQANLIQAKADLSVATDVYNAQVVATADALTALDQETENKSQALMLLNSARTGVPDTSGLQAEFDLAHQKTQDIVASYNKLINNYNLVYASYQQAQKDYQQAQQDLLLAQDNYSNNLIPDPAWVQPTIQVAHTREVATTTLVPRTVVTVSGGLQADVFSRSNYGSRPPLPAINEKPAYSLTVPNINFQWGGGTILGTPFYDRTLVRFTGNIVPPTTGDYQFYAPADDGAQLYIDGNLVINDWYDKGGGGSMSQPIHMEAGSSHTLTLYYYENGGGANVWLYSYLPQTGLQIVPASWLGTQSQTTTVYDSVTTYSTETYYTTEPDPNAQQPYINDPALLPALDEAKARFVSANDVWDKAQADQQKAAGDTTAGYDAVIASANIENDLYARLQGLLAQQAQAEDKVAQAQVVYDQAVSAVEDAQALYNKQLSNLSTLSKNKSDLSDTLNADIITVSGAKSALDKATADVVSAKQVSNQANTDLLSAQSNLVSAQADEASALDSVNTQQVLSDQSAQQAQGSADQASVVSSVIAFDAIQSLLDQPAPTPKPTPQPDPQPQPQGDPNIPAVITDLTQVNLDAVVPTNLTADQVQQLQDAANAVFQTAEQGSPEYNQALTALYVAAQADDIVLDPALANAPVIGAVAQGLTNAINFLGNAGADMSPQVRKESKKIVVAAVVAGQVAQVAGTAAAAAAGSSSSGGGASRRKENNPTNRKK